MNIPEGWKLVPVGPTPAMVEAAFDALPHSPLEGRIRTHYRAMLDAAPTPPAQDDEKNPWRDALENAGVISWTLTDETKDDPRKLLEAIIRWNVQVALDPAVSSDAQALIEQGRQDDETLEVLRLALDALTCGDSGDDLEDSHRCGRCDEYVDRNAVVRQRIRNLLTKRGK